MTELDYVARNQELWTEWSSDYAKFGQQSWAADAFDVVISEFGASIWSDPYKWVLRLQLRSHSNGRAAGRRKRFGR